MADQSVRVDVTGVDARGWHTASGRSTEIETIKRIGVVHIALRSYGVAPFRSFLESYWAYAAGRDHDVIIVLKGFDDASQAAPFLSELRSLRCTIDYQPDGGFDIGSYYTVMRSHVRDAYCLFNSRSRILGDDWLAKLCAPIDRPEVGVAGATGSYESLFTDHVRDAAIPRAHAAARWRDRVRHAVRRSPANSLRHWLRYAPFPNPHLRTNAFAIRRSVALACAPRSTDTRTKTAAFENGRRGLTARLARAGLRTVVVGRDGQWFDSDQWHCSGAFWQGEQSNLLVADNKTDLYALANEAERRNLRLKAWGVPV